MNRWLPLGIALALFSTAGCTAPGESPAPRPAARPHIILVSVDTMNRSALSAFSAEADPLPNLDAFAAGAARFGRAVSPSSWTLPAHASLLTGLYPDRHGATDPRRRIAQDVTLLAESLRAAGWETVAFTDAGYIDAEFGFARGFSIYNDQTDGESPTTANLPRGGRPSRERGLSLFDCALAYLEARDASARPLFLFVHTYSVHDYFRVHPWTVKNLPPVPGESVDTYRRCIQGDAACSTEDWARLRELYRAEVRHLDAGFGVLLAALRAKGLLDDAYVAFVSDHGEGFEPERGRIHHGGRLHADVLRVPLLLSGPGIVARDLDDLVSLVDVTPTLLELAGADVPDGLDGRSLALLLRGEGTLPAAPVFAMEHHYTWADGRRVAGRESRSEPVLSAVVAGADWLVQGPDKVELYETASDPDQHADLSASAPGTEVLRALVAQRLHALPASEGSSIDPALEDQLRSLGYVD
ncbi:MAG: sulfatase [Candidatus Eiseniibacteriota bacterium]